MKESNTVFDKMILGIEVALLLLIPFVILWSNIPTNILNSNSLFKLLEPIGNLGRSLILLAEIPVGIIGIIKAKRMIKFRKATLAFSIIHLVAGSIVILGVIVLFCVVVFGGASV